MSLEAHGLIALSLFFSAFAHGSLGFGSAVIGVSLTSLVMGIKTAVPFVALYSLLIAVYLLWLARSHIEWRYLTFPLGGALLGVPIGVWLLRSLSTFIMKDILGVFILCYVLWSILWRSQQQTIIRVRFWGFFSGMMGGIFGGAIAMPGPPFVTFVTLSPWTMDSMRGVLQAYMIFVYILFLTIFGAAELMEREILLMDLYHLPSVILGMLAGQAFFKRIPKQWFLRGIWVLLAVVGLKLIF